jgi:hypothetical protein
LLFLGKLLLLIKAGRGCNRSSGGTLPAAMLRDFSYLRGVMLRVNRDNLVTFDIYFMATRPPRNEIRINVAETNHSEVLLAEYLRNSGRSKPQSMDAIYGYWYSYALGIDRTVSNAAVELATSESVLALSGQINRVLNFQRIDRGIILPNEFLSRCGLAFGSSPPAVVTQERSVVTLPSISPVQPATAEPVKHSITADLSAATDKDVREPMTIGSLKVSPSVADFLNGTNGK